MKTPPSGRVEAVVIEGSRPAVCNDCGQTLLQGRLEVVFPPQCKGIKLWFTPTHQRDGAACPAKSVEAVRSDPEGPGGGAARAGAEACTREAVTLERAAQMLRTIGGEL